MSGPSSAPTSLCATHALRFRYTNDGGAEVLRGVTLQVDRGELIVVTGDNGCGKSTLLSLIAGELRADPGQVRWRGSERIDRRLVAYVTQDPELDPEMTCDELLRLLATLHGVPRRQQAQRIERLIDDLGVAAWRARRIQTLSGGQRRRVHLIAGLLVDAPLLVLDEPTTHLDARAQDKLWSHLHASVERGGSVIVAEHDPSALAHGSRHVALREGVVDRDDVLSA